MRSASVLGFSAVSLHCFGFLGILVTNVDDPLQEVGEGRGIEEGRFDGAGGRIVRKLWESKGGEECRRREEEEEEES